MKENFLYKIGKLCVHIGEQINKLIWDRYYNKKIGHFKVENTLTLLHKNFDYPSLNTNVDKYIKLCVVCFVTKELNR